MDIFIFLIVGPIFIFVSVALKVQDLFLGRLETIVLIAVCFCKR